MDNCEYISAKLQDEINDNLEGKICGIIKDKNTSAIIFLEKIKDSVKNLVKFRLHIVFWDFQTLMSLEENPNKFKKSYKLSYPIIFKKVNNDPIELKNVENFRNVEIKLNSSSNILAINLGENLFCKSFN